MPTLQLVPSGPFSLREAAMFGFGQRHLDQYDGVLRLAMCLDGSFSPYAVAVRQRPDGHLVEVELPEGLDVDLPAVRRQVARVLSLDHDGAEFVRLGSRDPVLGRLLDAAPGLRPPLFHSAYEAAAWTVLSSRVQARQAHTLRKRLSEQHGTVFQVAGQDIAAFPTPEQLLAVTELPGLSAEKLARLHGLARAALCGLLDVDRLRALEPADAMAELQTLRGIGPFSASLIVVRAIGHADVLPVGEQIGLQIVGELYDLGGPATSEQLEQIAQAWRPFRTWALVLVRAAAHRLSAEGGRLQHQP